MFIYLKFRIPALCPSCSLSPTGLHKHKRLFTEAGGQAHGCPDTLFDSDGEWFRWTFASLAAHNLTVPLIRVWEDGEILADVTQTGSYRGFEMDPVV